jgi:predicted AlkP superfamily pyrophosphatase or phosphodiesterase
MRFVAPALFLGLVTLGVGNWGPGALAQPPAPRLLVILVADQLRADYLDRYRHRWREGFRVLLDEGARFTRAEFPYLNTATCAGHVTIATGALPRTHGVILNRWWHRDEQRVFDCMDDEASPDVSYLVVQVPPQANPPASPSAPARADSSGVGGNSARRVLVPTLADRLRAERPGARVVALSLKARAAVPLAGHGGDVVTWFDEPTRAFVTSRAFSREPIESVRAFIARDPPENDHGKVWTLGDRESTYRHADLAAGERPKAGWTAVFPHRIVGADGADAQYFDRWQKSPFSDAFLGRMAAAVVGDLQLGQRSTTDYLAISFSALDLAGHDFGPDSREVEDLLMRLDGTLGALLRRLDELIGRDNYIVALTADHGAAPTPEQAGGGRVASEDVQQIVEQALVGRWGRRDAAYVAWAGSGSIYFASGVYERLQRDSAALQSVMRALLDVPGIMRVVRAEEITAASRDPLIQAAAAGYRPGRTADLLLVPKRHWVVEWRAENEATNHGTFHEYDRRVPILLRGHRVRPGRYDARVSPADIAPTLAYLAGMSLPTADGRVLTAAIR